MSNVPDQATYRILDANSNRAAEGLRTLEECARFSLNEAKLSEQCKKLRHDLTAAIDLFSREKRLQARDTGHDVGTQISAESEANRQNIRHVVAAAAARTQQSLRVLEEYGKTIDPSAAAKIEQVRYRCYETCRELELQLITDDRRQRLATSQLYVLVSAGDSQQGFQDRIRLLFDSGVDVIQLRDRSCDDRTLLERAKAASVIARESNGLFIVNDRCDLAVASDADGVHVGQDEMPGIDARGIIGTRRLLGISTHNLSQVHAAITDDADYIGCGPVFAGKTKCFDRYVGPEFLSEVHNAPKANPLPAFAIGGITGANLDTVLQTGFHRIAVTGAIRDASDAATLSLIHI